jgi:hypothetical protein
MAFISKKAPRSGKTPQHVSSQFLKTAAGRQMVFISKKARRQWRSFQKKAPRSGKNPQQVSFHFLKNSRRQAYP